MSRPYLLALLTTLILLGCSAAAQTSEAPDATHASRHARRR